MQNTETAIHFDSPVNILRPLTEYKNFIRSSIWTGSAIFPEFANAQRQ